MGKQDKDEKSEVKQALTRAWDLWTRDIDPEQSKPKVTQAGSLPQLGDFEEEQDYEAIEEDRCMAADDDDSEDESGCDVLKSSIVLSTSTLHTMTQGKIV